MSLRAQRGNLNRLPTTAVSPRRHRDHGDRRTEDREQTTVGANHDSPIQTWEDEGDGEPQISQIYADHVIASLARP
jgi:hypothetical protein